MNSDRIHEFQETVWEYYRAHGRDLPWRYEPFDAYAILVSEIMLQQTQVARVIPKYAEFLERFPDVRQLAKASLADVIKVWSGLGYNRRAKYVHDAAKQLANQPMWRLDNLTACMGIGFNTAAAVMTYAYNKPLAFVETNIRTVYIHHFFQDEEAITDKQILPLIEQTLDREHPREWCWALMDYGAHLKNTVGNAARASKHYAKQSAFEGSARQIRGQVLKILAGKPQNLTQLKEQLPDSRLPAVLKKLCREGLISQRNKHYLLTS